MAPFWREAWREDIFLPLVVVEMSADMSGTKRLDWLPPKPNRRLSYACTRHSAQASGHSWQHCLRACYKSTPTPACAERTASAACSIKLTSCFAQYMALFTMLNLQIQHSAVQTKHATSCTASFWLGCQSVTTHEASARLTLLGLVSCCMDCFKLLRGPSTRHWLSLKWFSSTFHRGCLARTFGLPRMTNPYLALVRATFRRRGSLRNPIPCMLHGHHMSTTDLLSLSQTRNKCEPC